jgi:hypothetical protein
MFRMNEPFHEPRTAAVSETSRSKVHGSNARLQNVEAANERKSKRQRTAALQDLSEGVARNPSRQRLGVRLSSAAFVASGRTRYSVPLPQAALSRVGISH